LNEQFAKVSTEYRDKLSDVDRTLEDAKQQLQNVIRTKVPLAQMRNADKCNEERRVAARYKSKAAAERRHTELYGALSELRRTVTMESGDADVKLQRMAEKLRSELAVPISQIQVQLDEADTKIDALQGHLKDARSADEKILL
jgi:hypothetical protein